MFLPSIFNDNVFDNWMNMSFPELNRVFYSQPVSQLMKTDVKEDENGYELSIDLPGFKKEEITAELKDGTLIVSASREAANDTKDENSKTAKYIRQERYSGSMSRRFYIGDNITENDIHAKFENGILTLNIPKKPAQKEVEENHFVSIEG